MVLSAGGATYAFLSWSDRRHEAALPDPVAALPSPRPFATRLSGGLPHAPCVGSGRGEDELIHFGCANGGPKRRDASGLLRLERSVRRQSRRLPPIRGLHQRARFSLAAWGLRSNLDRAVTELATVVAEEPFGAEALSDLAAALAARAERDANPADLVRALDAAERAVQASPEMEEAQWNLLVVTAEFSRPAAQAICIRLASSSEAAEWRAERLDFCQKLQGAGGAEAPPGRPFEPLSRALPPRDLPAPALPDEPHELAEYLQEELLPRWATAVRRDDLQKARLVGEAVADLGERLRLETGDTGLDGVGSLLEELGGEPGALRLAEGIAELRAGIDLEREGACTRATDLFASARARLSTASPYLASLAAFHRIRCEFRLLRTDSLAEMALAELRTAEEQAWLDLEGAFSLALGTLRFSEGQMSAALASYQRALARHRSAKNPLGESAAHTRLAGTYDELGEPLPAWRHRLLALQVLRFRENRREYVEALAGAAYAARGIGQYHAAHRLASAELAAAQALGDPLYLQLAIRHQADLQTHLGAQDESAALLGSARSAVDRIADPEQRTILHTYLDLVEARALRRREPEASLALLSAALTRLRPTGQSQLYLQALRARADLWADLGRPLESAADLEAGIDEIERLRAGRLANQHRLALLAGLTDFSRARLRLALELGASPDELLAIEERGRARLVLDWLSRDARRGPIDDREPVPAGDEPFEPPRIADLPDRLAVVEYSLLGDRALAWVVTNRSVSFAVLPLPSRLEATLKSAPGTRVQTPLGASLPRTLEGLFETLVQPLMPSLAGADTLLLAPDSTLSAVPFSILRQPSGRFLVEDYSLAVVPSLSVLGMLLERRRPADSGARTFLAVANPAFTSSAHPSLDPLPNAEDEARHLAGLFAASEILFGQAATRERVRARFRSHWGLHFGTHAFSAGTSAVEGRLLLAEAAAGDGPGYMGAEDLLRVDPRRTRFVFLAACGTGRSSWSEVAPGLAWPLLAAGVPQVVATVAEVRDQPTSALVQAFYSHLAATGDVALSLRRMQLACLAAAGDDADAIALCGSFQLYGLPST